MVREGYGSGMDTSMKPAWLEGLIAETFFGGCGVHENRRKNEKNVFCLQCCLSICPHCLPSHSSHPLLQVRRYVYHDVVRLADLEKLIDCSFIQPYTINGAKVIFLNQRPQSRIVKGSANICFTCDRILQEPFHFCSLSCKVDWLVNQGEDLSTIIFRFDESDFTISQFEGLRMDGSDVITDDDGPILEDALQNRPLSGSGSHEATSNSATVVVDAAAKKKKKKGSGFFPEILLGNRRKGAPQRAPLS
ncbi:hypothetical protein L484_009854 [Morus notabilis]|uniref:B box-type domain-containing protein n=1 Tax=Morus notabilis TaxID=981085 RepID=W9R777_9ROSA|nr:uncharacterized protein LOC21393169 [Morus notabilis]XP_024020166.1 uncharacterized protein LOC21393169 [Morus notabilis]EXB56428.1 hypothetical protein L484_009854 [Morus notabilis]